ncbi:hypothetical protein SCP_0114960 [Sparassis crispa]|uniref:Uncharacterized protein n=1 Tax=Sparassis crispa TaxID=139825 RepID=A0A401G8X1_9APHY|nr:hypothetical protein SCP_0114960 [Sparassis crispa]GBE78607.1 hypothetical protein SCP_0114960 [Sparassis crispa]
MSATTKHSTSEQHPTDSDTALITGYPWIDIYGECDMKFFLFPPADRIDQDGMIHPPASVINFPPYDRLPVMLVGSAMESASRPPVLHCGWVANEEMLLQYARDHRLPVFKHSPFQNMLVDSSSHDGSTGNKSDNVDVSRSLTADDFDPKSGPTMTYTMLLRDALFCMIEELNSKSPWPINISSVVHSSAPGGPHIISLFTNHDFAEAPSASMVEALRLRLGEPEQPKWYLSHTRWKWAPADVPAPYRR